VIKIPRLEISILPIDGIHDFAKSSLVSSLIILSKEKGSICKITSTGAIVDCDRDSLLRILKELDGSRFDALAKKFTISVDFGDRNFDSVSDDNKKIADDTFAKDENVAYKGITSASARREMIHNMVLSRLRRRVKSNR
jgi:uncharacterized protein YqgV (UPF0045/DUF77 family)